MAMLRSVSATLRVSTPGSLLTTSGKAKGRPMIRAASGPSPSLRPPVEPKTSTKPLNLLLPSGSAALIATLASSASARAEEISITFSQAASDASDNLSSVVSEAVESVGDSLNAAVESLPDALSETVSGAVDTVSEAVGGALDTVTDVVAASGSTLEGVSDGGLDVGVLLVGGGAVAVVLAAGAIALLSGKPYAGDLTAEEALALLRADAGAILLDIRSANTRGEKGAPYLKKKKPVAVELEVDAPNEEAVADPAFLEAVKVKLAEFLEGLQAKVEDKEAKILVLDSYGVISSTAATTLSKAGYSSAYAIKGGAEGEGGWKESGLPWSKPLLKLPDFAAMKKTVEETVENDPSIVPKTLTLAAALAGSVVLFSEAETALEVLGLAAVAQIFLSKFLYFDDRQKTLQQLKDLFETKVVPDDLVKDVKGVVEAFATPKGSREELAQALVGGSEEAAAAPVDEVKEEEAVLTASSLPAELKEAEGADVLDRGGEEEVAGKALVESTQ